MFLKLLAAELANTGKSVVARMAAGLQFKNRITSKDPDLKIQYQRMWLSFGEQDRSQIKQLVSISSINSYLFTFIRYYKL